MSSVRYARLRSAFGFLSQRFPSPSATRPVSSETSKQVGGQVLTTERSFTEPVPKRREDGFAQAGIAAIHGRARLAGPTTVQIGEETLEGWYVVIAAGMVPADLKIPGEQTFLKRTSPFTLKSGLVRFLLNEPWSS